MNILLFVLESHLHWNTKTDSFQSSELQPFSLPSFGAPFFSESCSQSVSYWGVFVKCKIQHIRTLPPIASSQVEIYAYSRFVAFRYFSFFSSSSLSSYTEAREKNKIIIRTIISSRNLDDNNNTKKSSFVIRQHFFLKSYFTILSFLSLPFTSF